MNYRMTSAWLLALGLAACDLGKTNLGELPEETGDGTSDSGMVQDSADSADSAGDGVENCDFWTVQSWGSIGAGNSPMAVLPRDGGYILGATPTNGELHFVDRDGVSQGTLEIDGMVAPEVTDLAPDGDGFLVVGRAYDPIYSSDRELWVRAYTADGGVRWESVLGAAHSTAWARGEAMVHPDGGHIISWHDSLADGSGPTLRLARLDDLGTRLWQTTSPLVSGSSVGINWAQGSVGLLSDGDIVQLTSEADGLRLVRTDQSNGTTVTDAVIEDVTAWPKDMVILPDDSILVLANTIDDAMLLEVTLEGTVLDRHEYANNTDPFLDAMVWDPSQELLFLGGEDRDASGRARPWTLIVDRFGAERSNQIDIASGSYSAALDMVLMPGGGVLASRHGDFRLETITHCTAQ